MISLALPSHQLRITVVKYLLACSSFLDQQIYALIPTVNTFSQMKNFSPKHWIDM